MEFFSDVDAAASHHRLRGFVRWILDVLVVIFLALLIVEGLGDNVTMQGNSMSPAIEADQVVLTDRLCYNFREPKRLDVVCFPREVGGAERIYVKRIIGLPGETVQIKDGLVLINGTCPDPENDLYKVSVAGMAEEAITLGENEYFVLGDNHSGSEDSRFPNIGLVTRNQIIGRLWFVIRPFVNMKIVK